MTTPITDDTVAVPLWCVHVRGPDDLVPVASYDDAVRLSDSLNWWWANQALTKDDPIISAIPALWLSSPERHAEDVAKLGTKGADYGLLPQERVDALMQQAFDARVAARAQRDADKATIREMRAALEPLGRNSGGSCLMKCFGHLERSHAQEAARVLAKTAGDA